MSGDRSPQWPWQRYNNITWTARLQALGRVVKAGQTIGLIECEITDEEKNPVTRASSTCMTLRGQQAEGR
jgi:hypothetical protein